MSLTRLAIEYDRVTTVVVILAIIGGLTCYQIMPRDEDPGFTIHTAMVTSFFPGASPERVEQLVTDKLEKAIQEIPELDKVRSESRPGVSLVWVDIQEQYRDLQPIWDKLRRKMNDAKRRLPPGTIGPFVNDEFGDVFGIIITITGDGFSYADLKTVADETRDRLLHLPDTAKVALYGTQDERVFVEYKNARLAELGLSPYHLVSILESRNILLSGGRISTENERIVLEPTGNFENIDDLRKTVISLPGRKGMVYLGDVVTIRRGYIDPPEDRMHTSGVHSVGLGISLRSGGNIIRQGQMVRSTIERLQSAYPWGLEYHIVAFQPDVVDRKVNEFADTLLQAIGLVLLVMILAMGIRMGFLVASLIPVTILGTVVLMWILNIGLDQVSLSSLIIALGMLVDNAIVMVESIVVLMSGGKSGIEAAEEAASELAVPLLSSSLTTAAAFLPIYLAQSTTGEYTNAIFKVVTMTLLCSWILSLTMTPLLCVLVLKKRREGRDRRYDCFTYRSYRWLLTKVIRWRLLTLAVVSIVFYFAIMEMRNVPFIFFPPREGSVFTAEFSLPPGTPIERTEKVIQRLENFISKELAVSDVRNEGIENWVSFIGRSAPRFVLTHAPIVSTPENAMIVFNTTSQKIISSMISRMEKHCFDHYPDLDFTLKRIKNGPPIRYPIEMKISGPNLAHLFEITESFKTWMEGHPGLKNIQDDWGRRSKKLKVKVNQPRARRAGVSSRDIALSLQTGLSGIETTQFREGDKTIPIVLRSEESEHQDIEKLDTINVFSQQMGHSVPLKQVADMEVVWQPAKIKRLNRKRTVAATAELQPGYTAAQITKEFQSWLEKEKSKWPFGYSFTLGGEMAESGKANLSIMVQLPVALAIILLLLVTQFNSIRQTIIILATIPLGMIGVTIGLVVMESYFGFMTLLGVVSLSGIVVNNAIVLLDRIRIEREINDLDGHEAIIVSAQRRLRPILLTTATTIGGLVPLYTSGGAMWQPMAVAIMFGLGFSTLLTLGVVPVLYALFYGIREGDER